MKIIKMGVVLLTVLAFAACSQENSSQNTQQTTKNNTSEEITGAGSSFVYPVLSKWAATYYKEKDIKVNYQPIGSGGGLRQLASKTVDFAASDKPLDIETLNKEGKMQFPVIVGGIVPIVNIAGIKAGDLQSSVL